MILKIQGNEIPIVIANTFSKRLLGLMGVSPMTYGMLFPKCNAIHTFFMKENIDVVGLNQKNQVIYLYQNLPKNQIIRVSRNIEETTILELPHSFHIPITLGETLFFENEDVI